MPLSSEAQAIFDHARNSLPRWLHTGRTAALEWLHGYIAIFDPIRLLAQEWLDGIALDTATGRWLDQHARDRDTTRRIGETDAVLRERIRQIEDAITDPALQSGINSIVGASFTAGFDLGIQAIDVLNNNAFEILIPIGTYTAREMLALIRAQLPTGWTFEIINARARFYVRDPDTGDHVLFSFTGGDQEAFELLGFWTPYPNPLTNWDTEALGYMTSNEILPGFCAITHLRRSRAHMHSTIPIVVADTWEFDATDEISPTETVLVTAGTYTIEQMINLIQGQLPPDWVFTITQGRARFSFPDSILNVSWTDPEIGTLLGYTGNIVDWDSTADGPAIAANSCTTHFSTSFLGGGYRMTNPISPMTYVVMLPVGSSVADATAVEEYLRQFGPAGYVYLVETRRNGVLTKTLATLTTTATGTVV